MKDIKRNIEQILKEIATTLSSVDQGQIDLLSDAILKADKIVVCGAGRVGMAVRAFGMRLGHLGLRVFSVGDSTVPAIGKGDLFIVGSGSGETQTIHDLVEIAKKHGATVALITGDPTSRMGRLADIIVVLRAPSKTKPVEGFKSVQPMTTLNEQCIAILCDAVVLKLMDKTGETHDTMWERHSRLE